MRVMLLPMSIHAKEVEDDAVAVATGHAVMMMGGVVTSHS